MEIKLLKQKLLVSSIYRPPNTNTLTFSSNFEKLLKNMTKTKYGCIVGLDHNLDLLKSSNHHPTQLFLENVLQYGLIPCITHPTRITKSSATLIDNIIVSRDIYNNTRSGIILSDISDHFPCIARWSNVIKNKKTSITTLVKKIHDKLLPNIAEDLNCDWNILNKINDVNKSYQLLYSKLTNVLNKYMEEKIIRISYKRLIREPWLTKGIINSNNKQLSLYKEWLMNKNVTTHERYKQYRDTLRKIKRNCKLKYYNLQCERFKQHSKKLWSVINEVCGKTNDKSSSLNYLTINGIKQYHSQKIVMNL